MNAPSIQGLLDRELGLLRLRDLTEAIAQFAGHPLDHIVTDLRSVIRTRHLSREDERRLHILISELCHQCGADVDLARQLRDELFTSTGHQHPEGGDPHVLSDRRLPQGRLHHGPDAADGQHP